MRTGRPSSWMSRTSGSAAVQPLVLVVEAEPHLGCPLVSTLANHGFRTLHAGDRGRALMRAMSHEPDLVLVDAGSPGTDSAALTGRLRESTSAAIVVLLEPWAEDQTVGVLEAGANDYLVKPFATAALLSRMRVWLHAGARARGSPVPPESRGDRIRIVRERRLLFVEGREVHITPLECKLLLTLARGAGGPISEEQIVAALWASGSSTRGQHLRALIRQLRQKIEKDPIRPRHLVTEIGGGYRLKLS
jgi:two-component system, OmpR family, KDP operon response regulator KdpE